MTKKILSITILLISAATWFMLSKPSIKNQEPTTNFSIAKEFTVTSKNFSFDPSIIKAKLGEKIKITIKNTEGFHDLKIDEFSVATKKLNGLSEDSIEFTADKLGTFEYYCSVGQHRAMGMKGALIIEE